MPNHLRRTYKGGGENQFSDFCPITIAKGSEGPGNSEENVLQKAI